MRMYLISDNVDTQVGMRLAGIEGEVVHEYDEVRKTLERVCAAEDIGIVLMTKKNSSPFAKTWCTTSS